MNALVVAPDKFKGAATARDVALALEAGWRDVWGPGLRVARIPMADGGDGTVAAFLDKGAQARTVRVRGPLGDPVDATFALDGTTAVVESAAASGLVLVPAGRRDALRAGSYGTGELIRAALDAGARRIVVGIGGSASTDGGAGMLAALGAVPLTADGRPIDASGGGSLAQVARIDVAELDPRLRGITLEVASDVDNPLTGQAGAAAVYGPQKGASAADVAVLDAALGTFADAVAAATGRDLRAVPGAGAAGGIGFALLAVCGGAFRSGAELVGTLLGLPEALAGAGLCLTGEGRIDAQTLYGKAVDAVTRTAREHRVPVLAFGGSVELAVEAELFARGAACVPIAPGPLALEESIARTTELLRAASARAARCWLAASPANERRA